MNVTEAAIFKVLHSDEETHFAVNTIKKARSSAGSSYVSSKFLVSSSSTSLLLDAFDGLNQWSSVCDYSEVIWTQALCSLLSLARGN